MQRNITAIYRTRATATLVRDELEQLAPGRHRVTILPENDGAGPLDGTQDQISDHYDRLHDLGLPDDDTRTYQQALRNGDHVVSVSVGDDADLVRIQEIMRRPEDAYDLDALDAEYSTADYVPRRETSDLYGTDDTARAGNLGGDRALGEDRTLEVVEEHLEVGKRQVEAGTVRVHSYVREVPVQAEVDLRATRVYVERRPVDRLVTPGEAGLPNQVLEAHEVVERPVVSKEARVVEEIGLREEAETVHETVHDTVRKTEVEIEDSRDATTSGRNGGTTGSGTY